jgi:hypothetical protein
VMLILQAANCIECSVRGVRAQQPAITQQPVGMVCTAQEEQYIKRFNTKACTCSRCNNDRLFFY